MPRSTKSYLGWVHQLVEHYPDEEVVKLSSRKVLDFLIHLKNDRNLAGGTLNQAICSLRTLYRDHLGLRWKIWSKVKVLREVPLPHVLTREEVAQLLGCFRDGRYRAYFTLVYQTGLRLSEALQLRPKDIDGKRLVIRVNKGKGGKSREVPISPALLNKLRIFWKSHRNEHWLFPATGRGWKSSGISLRDALHSSKKHMQPASIWAAMKVAGAALSVELWISNSGVPSKKPAFCQWTTSW